MELDRPASHMTAHQLLPPSPGVEVVSPIAASHCADDAPPLRGDSMRTSRTAAACLDASQEVPSCVDPSGYNQYVLEPTLLILAATGWLASVLGAVLIHRGSAKLANNVEEGTFTIFTSEAHSRWGLTLVVAGASAGALGTILAVIQSN